MYNIKTLNKISPAGTDQFDRAKYNVRDTQESPDAILVRSASMHDMEPDNNLLCIARAGAGTNNIPIERCAEKGIVVFNTPGANAEAVKEMAICALLLASRDILGGIEWVKSVADRGADIPTLVESEKNAFVGPELSGKKLGVIGLGAVGGKIANDAIHLGMQVIGHDPGLSVEFAWRLHSQIARATDITEIYRNCDYITIHVPYMESTHHYIGEAELSQMKNGVRIINLSRAELVDDDAMLAAIDNGRVSCYVTDFPNEKTANAPGVIAIPHLASSTPESEEKCAFMAARQIIDYIENGNIVNSVNMPFVTAPRMPGEPRVCVMHRNIPDMISRIAGEISSRGINIENMMNSAARNGTLAYTMIDISKPEPGLREAIEAIDGIVRVRILS